MTDMLPDGTAARDDEEYVRAWRGFGRAVAPALPIDAALIAWDPGLTFQRENGSLINLDNDVALRIIAALDSAREEGRREGRAEERAAVVAWLLLEDTRIPPSQHGLARRIERGEHIEPKEKP